MRGDLVVEGGDRAREAGVDGDVDHVSQRKFATVLGVSARILVIHADHAGARSQPSVLLAEAVRFELTVGLPLRQFSRLEP